MDSGRPWWKEPAGVPPVARRFHDWSTSHPLLAGLIVLGWSVVVAAIAAAFGGLSGALPLLTFGVFTGTIVYVTSSARRRAARATSDDSP